MPRYRKIVMTVSIPVAVPRPGLPLLADPPQTPWHRPTTWPVQNIMFAALGSKQFLFGDHPSLLPGQGVGQAEASLPASLLRGLGPLHRGGAREEHLAWSFES